MRHHANGRFDWLIFEHQSVNSPREAISILSGKYKRFTFVHPMMSHHHLYLYRKLVTVLSLINKTGKAWHKTMSHHSKHHFITQYISLRGTAMNEFYRMIRMGVVGGNRTETNEQ